MLLSHVPAMMEYSLGRINGSLAANSNNLRVLVESNAKIKAKIKASDEKYIYRKWALEDWNNASWTSETF